MFTDHANNEHFLLIIGDYLYNPVTGQLSGPSGAHYLNARVSSLLACLLAHAGQVVERDELIRRLWPDAEDGGAQLCRAVSRLRQVVGDTASTANYIVTVPHHGYRLVASVYGSAPKPAVIKTPYLVREAVAGSNRVVRFLREFRERKVCRSMLIYSLVIWLVFQVADVVVPVLNLPDWVHPLVVFLGILGFPVAFTLSWLFDMTPSGPVLDHRSVTPGSLLASRSRNELLLDVAMVGIALLVSGMLVFGVVDKPLVSEAAASPSTPEFSELVEPQRFVAK